MVLFGLLEVGAAVLWRPSIVGSRLYSRYSASFDYGYADDVPRLFREGDRFVFHPSEYVNTRAFSIASEKPAGTIRIFTLGGSVSRGSGLPEELSYSKRLETTLRERHPQYRWEVVNLSADGFGTHRMARMLASMLRFEPDALILHPHGTNEFEDEQDARYKEDLHSGVNGLLLRSRALVLLKKFEAKYVETSEAKLPPSEAEALAESDPDNVARWMENMRWNLRRLECMAEAAGTPAVYLGRAERDGEGFRNERVERLNEPVRGQKYYIEVASLLEGQGTTEKLFFDNTHYDALGHELVARRLAELFDPSGELFAEIEARNATLDAETIRACMELEQP